MLGGAAYAAVSRDFRSVLHLRSIRDLSKCKTLKITLDYGLCRSSVILRVLHFKWAISICDNDEPGKQLVSG